jgi:hypothetical protein
MGAYGKNYNTTNLDCQLSAFSCNAGCLFRRLGTPAGLVQLPLSEEKESLAPTQLIVAMPAEILALTGN